MWDATIGDVLVGLAFALAFALVFYYVALSHRLSQHMRLHHTDTWNDLHHGNIVRRVFLLWYFFFFFGWTKFWADKKLRSYVTRMLASFVICMAIMALTVALAPHLRLKIFCYAPDGSGGGTVTLCSSARTR